MAVALGMVVAAALVALAVVGRCLWAHHMHSEPCWACSGKSSQRVKSHSIANAAIVAAVEYSDGANETDVGSAKGAEAGCTVVCCAVLRVVTVVAEEAAGPTFARTEDSCK